MNQESKPTSNPDAAPSTEGAAKESPFANARGRIMLELDRKHILAAIVGLTLVGLVVVVLVLQQYLTKKSTSDRLAKLNESLLATQSELAEARKNLEVLDARAQRLDGQRAALEQLVVEINSGRDEALLIEIERLVNAAANELQLSSNVPAAVAALKSADTRLASVRRPSLLALRRSIAGDLKRLRALPELDVTGIALQLDQIADGIDAWPMLADPTVPLASEMPAQGGDAGASEMPHVNANHSEERSFWGRVRQWLGTEFAGLVRVRSVQTPESVLLSSAQQQLIRHQLLLRLFDARQALIARNDALYQADLQQAQHLIKKYFDLQKPEPASALSQINELAKTVLFVDIPNAGLTETLAAVASVRAAQENTGR